MRVRVLLVAVAMLAVSGTWSQARPVRVLLQRWDGLREVALSSEAGLRVFVGEAASDPDGDVVLRAFGGEVETNGSRAARVEVASKDGIIRIRDEAYRGRLRVEARDGVLRIVNVVALESYLLGVVPAEMPSGFPIEAIKAQAVAARTYMARSLPGTEEREYDLTDGEDSQVYRGVAAETEAAREAVMSTCGQVLMWRDEFCFTPYSADCGGYTASAADIGMNGDFPYLPGSPDAGEEGDFCRDDAAHEWRIEIVPGALASALFPGSKGSVTGFEVTQTGPSGRALGVKVRTEAGESVVTGAAVRRALGLSRVRSTRFTVRKSDKGWIIEGKGWGHGAGLCQYGAAGRARAGQSCREILAAYYPGAELFQLVAGEAEPRAVRTGP